VRADGYFILSSCSDTGYLARLIRSVSYMAVYTQRFEKYSYLVHAQFISGIMIGIFAYFGHLLIDK